MVVFYNNRNPAEIARNKTPLCRDRQFSVKTSHTGRYEMRFWSPACWKNAKNFQQNILYLVWFLEEQIKEVQKRCDHVFFQITDEVFAELEMGMYHWYTRGMAGICTKKEVIPVRSNKPPRPYLNLLTNYKRAQDLQPGSAFINIVKRYEWYHH